jgi:hypothetical protein
MKNFRETFTVFMRKTKTSLKCLCGVFLSLYIYRANLGGEALLGKAQRLCQIEKEKILGQNNTGQTS